MKKLSLLRGSMILALAVGGLAGCAQQAQMARADGEGAAVSTLLLGAMNASKQYTKKTKIFLKTEAVADIETHFHLGAVPQLERSTYYDENAGALLMGDYDGGFTSINAGFINDGEGNCDRYVYAGAADKKESDLFSNRTFSYKANGQTVGGYYQTLTSLAAVSSSATWSTFTSNGYTVYKYTVGDKLTVTDGAYDDNVLNAYQYFVAPLLLRDNYISYDSIWVTQAGSFLSIRLYATDSDSGKSTVTPGEHDVLIAEARVYEGLSFEPETKWYLKGDFNSWGETDRMVYTFDAYNPEQYSISKAVTAGQKFKLYSSAGWKGYSDIQTNAEKWFNDDNDDIVSKINGTITIYWKPGENKMWIEVPGTSTAEYTMTVTNDWDIFSNSAVFYLWVWGNGYGSGDWVTVTNPSGKTFKATIRIEATNFELVRMDPGKTCPSWDAKWNSGQTALTAGTLLYDITF